MKQVSGCMNKLVVYKSLAHGLLPPLCGIAIEERPHGHEFVLLCTDGLTPEFRSRWPLAQ
jgi:hypothetical protein